MLKISRVDAYAGFDEMDFKVMDQELEDIFHSDQRNGREMTTQFYLADPKSIFMIVYWDGREVARYRFDNKAKLTEPGKKDLRKSKKDIASRISYYLKKVAERGSIHPSKAYPASQKYRGERLKLYKQLMHAEIEELGYKK